MQTIRSRDESEQALLDRFNADLALGLDDFTQLKDIELVVGIPNCQGDRHSPQLSQILRGGLELLGLDASAMIVFVGHDGATMPDARIADGPRVHSLLLGNDLEGRGWATRAILELAARLDCPCVVLRPDLTVGSSVTTGGPLGFAPPWIVNLVQPILDDGNDLALAQFCHHPLANVVESLLAYPIFNGIFGLHLVQPTPGAFALSQKLIRACLAPNSGWTRQVGAHGVDTWLVATALTGGFAICEVPLGIASYAYDAEQIKLVFHQVTRVLLDQVKDHRSWWLRRKNSIAQPLIYGPKLDVAPSFYDLKVDDLRRRFKLQFDHFDNSRLASVISDEFGKKMKRRVNREEAPVLLTAKEWIHVLQTFVLSFGFERQFHPDDIVDGLFPFFLARLTSFVRQIKQFKEVLYDNNRLDFAAVERIVRHEANFRLDQQADLFAGAWPDFCEAWRNKERDRSSFLPRVAYWEFVPHVGVIVPQEIKINQRESVWARDVYQRLIDQYRQQFTRFLSEHLELAEVIDSSEILDQINRFMRKLDWTLDVDLFQDDFSTVTGATHLVEQICQIFAPAETFQLTGEATFALLNRIPPKNLIMQLGCGNVRELLERYDENDALAMAGWTDRQNYLRRCLDFIEKNGDRSWFHTAAFRPAVVDLGLLTNALELRETSALARLTGRVMVGNYDSRWGGAFPKLWFLLKVIKSVVGVELFAELWQGFADQGDDFCKKVVASISGHWGRTVLSAHNLFENRHQRILAARLKAFARQLKQSDPDQAEAADQLLAAASVYNLSITLPDATFVPLSAWTWASYSHRGGVGSPTPLSSLVERDWATRDFLVSYATSARLGTEQTIDDKIAELIGQGRESADLGEQLLGNPTEPDRLMVSQMPNAIAKPAGELNRLAGGPILQPLSVHPWESRYVLNAGAVRLKDTIYLIYRAFGDDGISRLGLAWSDNGVKIKGRLDRPIFSPSDSTESKGCEDPRLTLIGDRLYMVYGARGPTMAQIAMASISVDDFLAHRFENWQHHGPAFPGLDNRDATLYPATFDGRYVVYYGIAPNLWISYLDRLDCPFPKTGQRIVIGPRPGMMWDGVAVGAGAQPVETTAGWLNIYYGVDYQRNYRLGVLLTQRDDPAKVIYQSPNPILAPAVDFEIGRSENKDYWMPHVVFSCGAVPAEPIDILGPQDELLVYYGAANTAIGVASAKVADLVPIL